MLQSVKELTHYALVAEDGELGRCKDLLVDDRGWHVRYLVGDARKMIGAAVGAMDGDAGSLADFLIGLKTWKLRYAVIDTRKWLPGRRFCVDAMEIAWVDKLRNRMGVGLSKEEIEKSPECDPSSPKREGSAFKPT
jgi:hypothetical protein